MSGREKPLILQNGIPIPQAYDKDLGDWTEYSTEHIKAIKAELALVKAELQTIKANQLSGDQKVQLSGTKTILRPLNSVAIADTVAREYKVEVGKMKNLTVIVFSTLNQPVKIRVDGNLGVRLARWDSGTSAFKNTSEITIPVAAGLLVVLTTHPEASFLNQFTDESFVLWVKCDIAPTSGSLTVKVAGVPV